MVLVVGGAGSAASEGLVGSVEVEVEVEEEEEEELFLGFFTRGGMAR